MLFFDTTNRVAEGAVGIIRGGGVVRGEVQVVPAGRIVRCRHPGVAVRANAAELATGCITTAASGEE